MKKVNHLSLSCTTHSVCKYQLPYIHTNFIHLCTVKEPNESGNAKQIWTNKDNSIEANIDESNSSPSLNMYQLTVIEGYHNPNGHE